MTDWAVSADVMVADIVADVSIDVVVDITMTWPP